MRGVVLILASALVACGGATESVSAPLGPPVAHSVARGAPAPLLRPATPPPETEPDASALALDVERAYANALPFELTFEQALYVKSYDMTKRESGRVAMDRPGRVTIDYANGSRVVADAQVLTVLDAGTQQVFRGHASPVHCPAVLAFAERPGALDRHLALSVRRGADIGAPGATVLIGTPRAGPTSVAGILFYVDAPSRTVKRLVAVLGSGDRIRLDYGPLKTNAYLPPALFTVQLPPGTVVTLLTPPPSPVITPLP